MISYIIFLFSTMIIGVIYKKRDYKINNKKLNYYKDSYA